MPCNSNNFEHIEKILRNSVANLVLKISLKFQVDRITIVRVLLLAELENTVFDAEGCNLKNKIFLGTRSFTLHF